MPERLLQLTRPLTRPARRPPADRPTRFRLRTADAGGPVAYADFNPHGAPDGAPTLVLLHGLGGNHLNWLPAAPMLAKHARVLAVDLVGFGRTPKAGRSHGLGAQSAMLERFLPEVVRGPAVLLGNSMGGALALQHAARLPDQIAGLCLVSPALSPSIGARIPLAKAARYAAQATPGLGELFMYLEGRRVGARGLFMDLLTLGTKDVNNVPPEVVEANVSILADRMEREPLAHAQSYLDVTRSLFLHLLVPGLVDGWARSVRAPVSILHGAHDHIVPHELSEDFARKHGFEIDLLDTAGHVPQMEDARAFTDRVVSWLRRHALLTEPAAPPRSLRASPPAAAVEAAPRSLRAVPSANDDAPLTLRTPRPRPTKPRCRAPHDLGAAPRGCNRFTTGALIVPAPAPPGRTMKIYEEQLQKMGQERALEYERRVYEFVRDQLAGGSAREVDRLEIRQIIKEAHDAGLETERQVAGYVAGAWLYGEEFLRRVEPLRDRFTDKAVSPEDKAKLILDLCDDLGRAAPSA